MTPKEAFRDLCHKFHGIEPGKAKKEKRLRMYQEEVKAKKMSEEKSKLGAAEKMKLTRRCSRARFQSSAGRCTRSSTRRARSPSRTRRKQERSRRRARSRAR